jgi:hypothetical protein
MERCGTDDEMGVSGDEEGVKFETSSRARAKRARACFVKPSWA